MLLVVAAALFGRGGKFAWFKSQTTITTCIHLQFSTLSDCYANGDVRLNYFGAYSYRGILQVYMEGQWGTVCAKKFNFAAAAAVCRQLGYQNAAEEPQSIENLDEDNESACKKIDNNIFFQIIMLL